MNGDLINALFEAGMGAAAWANVTRIRRDKEVRGSYSFTTAFAGVWGFWNLWFYPANHLFYSFAAGTLVVAANSVWVYYAVKYRKGVQ